VRLIHLADYEAAYSGSFVPMLREALTRAKKRGWHGLAVFPEAARGRDWANALADEFEVQFLTPSTAAVAGLLANEQRTILHTNFTSYDLAAALAARQARNIHLVWQAQSNLPDTLQGQVRAFIKYTAARHLVDAILCVAPHIADEIRRRGAPPQRTLYLPNAIDTRRFRPPRPEERQQARAALGLPSERPVVLHYGWAWHRKGGDLFCAAVAELRRRGVEVIPATVGAGPDATMDARRYGIEDALVSLPPMEDVRQLLAAADVLALPSRAEGMPFAVLESLASEVPVVAGDIPGQTVEADLAAYRTVPLEPRALADAIAEQLGASDEARATARAHIEARRSLTAWAEQTHAIYDAILDSRPLPAEIR
jgi:glycosyltransferase involved in cell wall biosynthesis